MADTPSSSASASPLVLAFSGGLDTSFLVPWLRERYDRPVVTVTVDTGGLDDEARQRIADRSAALGAVAHHLVDGRETYFAETLRYLIMGNVLRGHLYPLCVGAERTLQARQVAEVARALGAKAVAHGSTAAGNDQVRFEVALRVLSPELEVPAPVRDEGFRREEEVSFLKERGHDFPSEKAAYSVNQGLWGVTIGGKETTDTVEPLPEEAWLWTRGALERGLAPRSLRVAFEKGVPRALDGEALAPVALIERLNAIAAAHGVGRGIHLGDTTSGSRGAWPSKRPRRRCSSPPTGSWRSWSLMAKAAAGQGPGGGGVRRSRPPRPSSWSQPVATSRHSYCHHRPASPARSACGSPRAPSRWRE